MTNFSTRTVMILAACLLGGGAIFGAEEGLKKRIVELVQVLSSDSYDERERATLELTKLAHENLSELEEISDKQGDTESHQRLSRIWIHSLSHMRRLSMLCECL